MILSRRDTGVGVWTRGLIGSLARLGGGNEYVIYHGPRAGPLPPPASSNARYVRVRTLTSARLFRILWEQVLLPSRVRRDGIEVLHCPAYVRPLRVGVPTVLTLHDLFAVTHPQFCKRLNVLHYRLALPPGIRRASVIHCTSEWTKGALAREFGAAAEKAHVVHPGVDDIFRADGDESGSGALPARLGLKKPPFLFVGNVEPKKNVPGLLAAYAEMKRRFGTERKLLLVGGPGWRRRTRPARADRLSRRRDVVQAGYVERARLPGLYRAALALVFPSLCEGFGLPPLEAMACGTPVICTGGSGLAESVGDAARIVPVGDVGALAEAMHEVEESPELRSRLRQGGLRRVENFRWQDKAPEFLRLYELAASAGPGVRLHRRERRER